MIPDVLAQLPTAKHSVVRRGGARHAGGAVLLLLLSPFSMSAREPWPGDIPFTAHVTIQALRVGTSEADIVASLRPVSLDFGKITEGGTGSGRLYFQVSATHQLWVEIDGPKGFVASQIGTPEAIGNWTRDRFGHLTVQRRETKPR
jgi:hypothetical protein